MCEKDKQVVCVILLKQAAPQPICTHAHAFIECVMKTCKCIGWMRLRQGAIVPMVVWLCVYVVCCVCVCARGFFVRARVLHLLGVWCASAALHGPLLHPVHLPAFLFMLMLAAVQPRAVSDLFASLLPLFVSVSPL